MYVSILQIEFYLLLEESKLSLQKKTLAFILCRRHIMSSNSFNTEKICILSTEYIYLDHMVLKINSDTSINSNN